MYTVASELESGGGRCGAQEPLRVEAEVSLKSAGGVAVRAVNREGAKDQVLGQRAKVDGGFELKKT
jgi:hypothetical protein